MTIVVRGVRGRGLYVRHAFYAECAVRSECARRRIEGKSEA